MRSYNLKRSIGALCLLNGWTYIGSGKFLCSYYTAYGSKLFNHTAGTYS